MDSVIAGNYKIIWNDLFIWNIFFPFISVRGPVFDVEPPNRIDFDNSTGAVVRCSAKGQPIPDMWWETKNGSTVRDIPGLQHVRSDGSLVFAPFSPSQYRREIHDAIYRCVAANAAGKLGSREVKVRAGKVHILSTAINLAHPYHTEVQFKKL